MKKEIVSLIFASFLVLTAQNSFAQDFVQLQGSLNFINKTLKLEIKPKTGSVELSAKLDSNSNFTLDVKLKHVKIGLLDILADVYSFGRIYYDKDNAVRKIKFDVGAVSLLVNHKPIQDLFVNFEISNSILKINSTEWFNSFLLGYLNLRRPYNVSLVGRIKQFNLSDFAAIFSEKKPNITGDLEGLIKLSGVLSFPQIEANLIAYNGQIKEIKFKEAVINFSGTYPLVRFMDSKILGEDDSLVQLAGFLDLSKFSNLDSPFHSFQLSQTGNKMRLADWNLVKSNISDRELTLTKEVDDNLSVAFNSYSGDSSKYKDDNDSSLDVRLKAGSDINIKIKQDEGVVGVGKRLEF